MKNDVLLKLLEDLPDDLIESAADPEPNRRPVFLRYAIPAIAACMVIVFSAVIYPKLKTEKPERQDDSSAVTETTVQPAGTGISGDAQSPQQTVTETDPYAVHIGTAPVMTFRPVSGTAVTDAEGQILNEETPEADPGDNPQPEDDRQQTAAPGKATAPATTRTRAQTTASARTAAQAATQTRTQSAAVTDAPTVPVTRPSEVTKAAPVETEPAAPPNSTEEPGKGQDSENSRIPCRYSTGRMQMGSGGEDRVGSPNSPPTAEHSDDAELHGNILTVRTDRPCTKAMISYLALKNGELRIEIYYDLTDRRNTEFGEFSVELPQEYAQRIWRIERECYEVDDIDEYDYDKETVTFVIL